MLAYKVNVSEQQEKQLLKTTKSITGYIMKVNRKAIIRNSYNHNPHPRYVNQYINSLAYFPGLSFFASLNSISTDKGLRNII